MAVPTRIARAWRIVVGIAWALSSHGDTLEPTDAQAVARTELERPLEEEPADNEPADNEPADNEAETEAAESAPAGELETLDGADPFALPLPPALQALAAKLRESDELDREAHRDTRLYQRLHPADPRPTLLLAHDLADRASWPHAVERYELAYARWPETMGDPRMLADLLQAFLQGEERASDLLVLAYGEDAVPAVEDRLAHSEHRPTRLVLRRLIDRLETGE